jgi:hypothetical protein
MDHIYTPHPHYMECGGTKLLSYRQTVGYDETLTIYEVQYGRQQVMRTGQTHSAAIYYTNLGH